MILLDRNPKFAYGLHDLDAMNLKKLITVLLFAGVGPLCSQVVIQSEIQKWPEYKQARVSAMKAVVDPEGGMANKPRELPAASKRKEAEVGLNAALKRLGYPQGSEYEWEALDDSWRLRRDDVSGERVYAVISAGELALEYLSVTSSTPLHPDFPKDSPESFTRYAADCYRKVFGEEPVGEAALRGHLAQADGTTYNGEVVWSCDVDGLLLGNNSFSLQYKDPGVHDLSLQRQVSDADHRDCSEYIVKYPVEMDEKMAVAIVYKTWEGMGKIPADRAADEMRHTSSLARTDAKAFSIWHISDRMLWENASLQADRLPPYVRTVSLSWGLFTVDAELDWRTGEILWMRQYTMSW